MVFSAGLPGEENLLMAMKIPNEKTAHVASYTIIQKGLKSTSRLVTTSLATSMYVWLAGWHTDDVSTFNVTKSHRSSLTLTELTGFLIFQVCNNLKHVESFDY